MSIKPFSHQNLVETKLLLFFMWV